jgi:ABC-type phosphate transport system substrate-binding protein
MSRHRSLAVALLLLATPVLAQVQDPAKVIVHPGNTATQIQRDALVAIYKGQMVRWKDNAPITPVDQSVRSPARVAFTEKVLRETVLAMQNYWMRQLQQGRVPPMVKASDQEVAAYVRANKGAIGYVTAGFALDEGVKVLAVVE